MKRWPSVSLIIIMVAWYAWEVRPATVSTHQFGRYEIVLQEGVPVAIGEILGLVRRQTGLPEYALMLGLQNRRLELSILGPGNRSIPLVSTPLNGLRRSGAATARFIVEGSVRQDETLTLRLRQASASGPISLALNLQQLERMLEGER